MVEVLERRREHCGLGALVAAFRGGGRHNFSARARSENKCNCGDFRTLSAQHVEKSLHRRNSLGTIFWQMLTLAYCRGEPARIQLAQRLLIRDQAGAWRFDRGKKR
jgi:hypothetical protein